MSILSKLEVVMIPLPVVLLLSAVVASSIAVVYSKYTARHEFVMLQKLEAKRDQLNEEWGRLLLEQSTWANPVLIENQSRLRLNMRVPETELTVFVKL